MTNERKSSLVSRLQRLLFGATTGAALFLGLGDLLGNVEYSRVAVFAEDEELVACADLELTPYVFSNAEDDAADDSGDATSQVNFNVDVRSGRALTDADSAYGLTDASKSGAVSTGSTISISNGSQGYVALLDEDSSELGAIVNGASLTLTKDGKIVVGVENGDSQGSLTVAGVESKGSTLAAEAESNIFVGQGGLLEIGGDSGAGEVVLSSDAQLFNLGGSSTTQTRGVVVNENGVLTLGSEDSLAKGNSVDGDGAFKNSGTVSIFNASGTDNRAYFGVYSDAESGVLKATGSVLMNGGSGTDGALTISGTLEAADWSTFCDATFGTNSSVKIDGLATVGSSKDGASLTVAGLTTRTRANVVLGGLKAYAVESDAALTGGRLTLNSSSLMQIKGLDTKFNAAGEQVSGGSYDVWLGSTMNLSGVVFSSENASGQRLNSELTSTGIRFAGASTINTSGGLYAKDLALSVGGTPTSDAASITSSGAFYITGELKVSLEESAKSFTLTNSALSTKSSRIGTWNLEKGMTLVNGLESTSSNTGTITVTNLTLSGGQVKGVATSTLNSTNFVIDSSDSSLVALRATDKAKINVTNFTLSQGLAILSSENGAGGLTSASDAAVYTIGKADQDSSSFAQLQLQDADATFGKGTLLLEGQGLVVQEEGHKLTFDGTAITNNTQRSDYALSADEIIFGSGASYSGGKAIRASSATFEEGSTLNLTLDSDLTIASGGSLTLDKGAVLTAEFGKDGETVSKAVLTGDATAKIAEGALIKASNVSALGTGTYSGVVIQTESDASSYAGSTESGAFYTLSTAVSEDGKNLLLNLEVSNDAEVYAKNANQQAMAKYVERVRTEDVSEGLRDDLDAFLALSTGDEASAALQSMAGVHRANAMNMAMNSPWRQAFAHSDLADRREYGESVLRQGLYSGQYYRGQAPYAGPQGAFYGPAYAGQGYAEGYPAYNNYASGLFSGTPRAAWFSANYRNSDVRSDGNSDAFEISDTGMNAGFEMARASGAVAGVVFGYSQPKLTAVDNHLHASNFQLGLYGGGTFGDGIEAKAYVGGGLQDYTNKRTARVGETSEFYRTTFNGQSLAAAARISKSFQTDAFSILRPVAQIDYQQVWLDGADEEGDGLALAYEKANWDQIFVRAGLETEYNSPFLLLSGRVLYGYQLSGDSEPVSKVRFTGAENGYAATITGVRQGDSFLEAGVSARGYVDCERRWSVGGDYGFILSDKSKSHLGTVSTAYVF